MVHKAGSRAQSWVEVSHGQQVDDDAHLKRSKKACKVRKLAKTVKFNALGACTYQQGARTRVDLPVARGDMNQKVNNPQSLRFVPLLFDQPPGPQGLAEDKGLLSLHPSILHFHPWGLVVQVTLLPLFLHLANESAPAFSVLKALLAISATNILALILRGPGGGALGEGLCEGGCTCLVDSEGLVFLQVRQLRMPQRKYL